MSVELVEKSRQMALEERQRLLEQTIRENLENRRFLQSLINEEFEEVKKLQVSLEKARPAHDYVAVFSRHWLE